MSPVLGYDHRLVQTAVVGDAHSDHPVILPMDAGELDAWRRRHPGYTYWCGYELGGCGGKLSDKLYHDKVCHFAHQPGGPACGRSAVGESSADHLFIKRGLRDLLGRDKQRGTVESRDLGSSPGGAVDLHLPAARRRVRFQLAGLDHRGWRAADLALGDDVDEVDWLFGTDGALTRELLARKGYSLRFRLETVGGERRVHIGAQSYAEPEVRWVRLEDCRITPGGLVTPAIEAIRLAPPRPKPFAFPVGGSVVFALDPEAPAPDTSPFATEGRRLIMAYVKAMDSPVVRTALSLPDDTDLPPAQHVYRAGDHARLLVQENGAWALQLDRYVRLDAAEAARTGLAGDPSEPHTPPVVQLPAVKAPPQPAQQSQPVRSVAARTPPPTVDRAKGKGPGVLGRGQAVIRARELLRDAARHGRTLRWANLASRLGTPYPDMSDKERAGFLIEVDTPLWESKPVLTALLWDRNWQEPVSCLHAVVVGLGVANAQSVRAGSSVLREWADRERDRAFAMHASPPRPVQPRMPLKGAQAVAQVLTRKQTREVNALVGRIAVTRNVKAPVSTPGDRRRVSDAIASLEEKAARSGTESQMPAQVHRALERSRLWLRYAMPGAHIPDPLSNQDRQAIRTSVDGLLQSLKAAEGRLDDYTR
ncbi:hypothetical protein ACFXGG_21355 [Streptomyces nigra]|uniref:hypothetical protein n=1 Tax=Streptomyces nigra TaxID=1827580 RepID=UPI0036C295F4